MKDFETLFFKMSTIVVKEMDAFFFFGPAIKFFFFLISNKDSLISKRERHPSTQGGTAIKNEKQKGEVQVYDKQKGLVQVLFVKGMLTKHIENILTKILN